MSVETPITESVAIKNDLGAWMVPAVEMQKLEVKLNEAYDMIGHYESLISELQREVHRGN